MKTPKYASIDEAFAAMKAEAREVQNIRHLDRVIEAYAREWVISVSSGKCHEEIEMEIFNVVWNWQDKLQVTIN